MISETFRVNATALPWDTKEDAGAGGLSLRRCG